MNRLTSTAAAGALSVIVATTAIGGTIVQDGSLSGSAGAPQSHTITLDQFDTLAGTRQLDLVQLDFLTAVVGGAQTDGSGTPVQIFARMTADYLLDNAVIAETEAVIDTTVANTGSPVAISFFDNDMAQVSYSRAGDLAPWIGTETIDLRGISQLVVSETPAGIIDFSAGGSVQYTVTYEFVELPPCPGDTDGNGAVDIDDIVNIVLDFGTDGAANGGDVDGSGLVDIDDIVLAVLNFGTCPGA